MVTKLQGRLRQEQQSYTRARELVYLAIARLGPCTKQAVVRELHTQVDSATVYRAIDLFLQIDIAQVVRYRLVELSDQFRQHHHHFVCRACGKESNFNDDPLEAALTAFAHKRGIQLESHQVELSGLCSSCAALSQR